MDPENNPWCCYLLRSLDTNKTYVGSTNNFNARLNTHNRGKGAKYTKGQTWLPVMVIHGFHHKNACLSFESKWKKLSRRRNNERFRLLNLLSDSDMKYSTDTIWSRILDVLYLLYYATLLGTKYVTNDPVKFPINPHHHLLETFTIEYNIASLPWPYFVEVTESDPLQT